VPETNAAPIPRNLTFEHAAAIVFGGMTSLFYLRDLARIQPGERVLINGASGAVGTAAVQLARHFGATVTGVCSGANAEFVRSLGAGRVIDYARDDFTQTGETYDIIFDAVGNCTFSRCERALSPGGRLLLQALTRRPGPEKEAQEWRCDLGSLGSKTSPKLPRSRTRGGRPGIRPVCSARPSGSFRDLGRLLLVGR